MCQLKIVTKLKQNQIGQLTNSNCDKPQTQIVTKLKKNQIVMKTKPKLKNLNCDKTQTLKI